MNRHLWFAATLAVCVTASAPALAQQVNDGWRVSVTPYAFLPAYDNDLTNKVTGEKIESSADVGDIFDALSGFFIGKAEVQYKRVGAYADVLYMKLSVDGTVERPLLGSVRTESELATTAATFSGFYRVAESDRLNVDLLAGVRYIKLKAEFDAAAVGPGLSRGGSRSVTEPIIGVRATQRIGSRSSLTGYGDYGGFGGDATVWQLYGTYNYQWTPKWTVSAGYRYFAIEIDKDRLSSDVTLSGPLLGLTYVF